MAHLPICVPINEIRKVMKWNNLQWKLRMIMFDCYQVLMGGVKKDISIFCNNCIGAFVAHDFRLPFNTTVNLMIPPTDYIEYISHMDEYTGIDMVSIDCDKSWPVALYGEKIHIHFIHYHSVEEGKKAWYRREKRISKEKRFYILVETDGCSYEDLKRFDNLPFKHKVALVHKSYPDIKCAFKINGYEKIGAVTDSYRFHPILPVRKYDQFNWMKFLKQV